MKAKQISKARKKIFAKTYWRRRLDIFREKADKIHTFEQFKCSDFFVGEKLAKVNRKIYEKDSTYVFAQLEWYAKKVFNNE